MNDVSKLTAPEIAELMRQCEARLAELREQHMQQAELLGLHCALPEGKQKKRRNSRQPETRTD